MPGANPRILDSEREGTWILINPAAAGGRLGHSRRLQRSLRCRLGSDRVILTQSAEQLNRETERLTAAGAGRIFACGGDGTVHAVLQAVVGTSTALGILPAGRGNDIARGLELPLDPLLALDLQLKRPPRRIDAARVGQKWFLGVAGAGLDAEVNRRADSLFRRYPGWLAYPLALLTWLPFFQRPSIRAAHRGGCFAGKSMLIAAGNLAIYGGGMRITPDASPQDGLLDVCLVRACSKWRILDLLPRVYAGKHLRSGVIEYWRTDFLEIESDRPLELRGDGESMARTPLRIDIVKQAVSILS